MLYNGMTLSGSGGPDFSNMSTDEMLAWIRSNYGNVGPVSSIEDPNGGVSGYSARDGMQMTPNGDGTFSGRVTGAYDGGGDGGQYGSWTGKFDAQGNLIGDAEWGKNDRSGSWLDQNGWMIPLAVAGWAASPYAMAGAGAAEGAGAAGAGWTSGFDLAGGGALDGWGGAAGAGGISGASMTPELSLGGVGSDAVGADVVGSDWAAGSMTNGGSAPWTSGYDLANGATNAARDVVGSDWAAGAATGQTGGLLPSLNGTTLANAAAGGTRTATTLSEIVNSLGGPRAVASVVGGLLGGAASRSGTPATQTSTKEPWGPAQDWLRSLITSGQSLQSYYQQNPISDLQKTAYQNKFSDLDNFRSNIAPQLFNIANTVSTPYVRGSSSTMPRTTGTTTGTTPATTPTTGTTPSTGTTPTSGGLLNILAPGGTLYGQIDWSKLNPFLGGLLRQGG